MFSHIPKDKRIKFDLQARKCILLGYGSQTKGYMLSDRIKIKVFHSRDVKFDENKEESQIASNEDLGHHLVVD